MEITKELRNYMKEFQTKFGDIVPLRELPGSVTTDQLIDAIKRCIELDENILPEIFGYGVIDENERWRYI